MKKCKMCTYVYEDGMGYCPECGAIDFEAVEVRQYVSKVSASPAPAAAHDNSVEPIEKISWGKFTLCVLGGSAAYLLLASMIYGFVF